MSFKEHQGVWVVLRYDAFHEPAIPKVTITAQQVVRSEALAKAEVERLNKLNAGKDCRYWYSGSRLFPEGRAAGAELDDRTS